MTKLVPVRNTLPILDQEEGLGPYLRQIRKFPMLSEEEEVELFRKWQREKCKESIHAIICSHLRLVPKIANNYRGYGLPMHDLIAEGTIGLMNAIPKYNVDLGFRFSTYASWWIKASIQDYVLKSWSMVRIKSSAAKKKLFFNLRKIKNQLSNIADQENIDHVSYIAEKLNTSKSAVIEMENCMKKVLSLNAPVDEEGETEILDTIADENANQEKYVIEQDFAKYRKKNLAKAFMQLSERERYILEKRHLKAKAVTLDILSQELGISKERVRQVEMAALNKMKQQLSLLHE